jgi:hypothetical protein
MAEPPNRVGSFTGYICAGDDEYTHLKFPGFVATASIGIGDWFAFSLQYQAIRFDRLSDMYPSEPSSGTQSAFYTGPNFGSWAAIALPVVIVLIYATGNDSF